MYDQLEIETSGKYLKIKSGESADIHILSEVPSMQKNHGYGKSKVTCTGKGCSSCAAGDRPRQRWTVNVWDRREECVKLFEFGAMVASQIKAIAEMLKMDGHSIHSVDLRIRKDGAEEATKYMVMQKQAVGSIPDTIELYTLPF